MVTESHKISLQPEQELAISALLAGKTDEQAGKVAGVTRECVNRWKNRDPFFRAQYNRRLQEVWESNKQRLRALVADALETVSRAVKDDSSIALKIIQSCKDLEIEPPTGPTSADEILLAMARELAEQELASKRQEESKGEFFITDPFEDARELAPLIKRHFSSLKKKYELEK